MIPQPADKKAPESNPIRRYLAKPTRSSAIKAKCAECMGCTVDSIEPGFRRDIRDCAAKSCPLYPFRPYQAKSDGADDDEAAEGIEDQEPAPAAVPDALAMFA